MSKGQRTTSTALPSGVSSYSWSSTAPSTHVKTVPFSERIHTYRKEIGGRISEPYLKRAFGTAMFYSSSDPPRQELFARTLAEAVNRESALALPIIRYALSNTCDTENLHAEFERAMRDISELVRDIEDPKKLMTHVRLCVEEYLHVPSGTCPLGDNP